MTAAAPQPEAREPASGQPRSGQPASPEHVFAVVQAAVARVLEVPASQIGRDTRLREDLRADSLALVEVVELVEEELSAQAPPGFHLDDDDLDGLDTVGAAVDYAVARLGGGR